MKENTSILKKLVALFLLGVFLFIHTGKVLHSHERTGITGHDFDKEVVSKSDDCSVCDFHFSKDTAHQEILVSLPQLSVVPVKQSSFQSRTTSSIGLSDSDRGPPSFS